MRSLFKATFGCVILAFMATAYAADKVSPTEVKGAITIDAKTAKDMFEQEVPFIDVRKDKDWDAGRIPGATHLELKMVYNEDSLSAVVNKSEPVVIYCNGPKCLRSSQASAKAIEWGFEKIYYFRGGIPEWKKASYPIE